MAKLAIDSARLVPGDVLPPSVILIVNTVAFIDRWGTLKTLKEDSYRPSLLPVLSLSHTCCNPNPHPLFNVCEPRSCWAFLAILHFPPNHAAYHVQANPASRWYGQTMHHIMCKRTRPPVGMAKPCIISCSSERGLPLVWPNHASYHVQANAASRWYGQTMHHIMFKRTRPPVGMAKRCIISCSSERGLPLVWPNHASYHVQANAASRWYGQTIEVSFNVQLPEAAHLYY